MARKQGSHAGITGPKVREAALRLFARHGYAAVSMRQIAAEVGVQAGALYTYTPDKQSLLSDLMLEHMRELMATLAEAPGDAGPLAALEGFVRNHIRFHLPRADAVFVSYMELRNLTPENFARVEALRRQYEDGAGGDTGARRRGRDAAAGRYAGDDDGADRAADRGHQLVSGRRASAARRDRGDLLGYGAPRRGGLSRPLARPAASGGGICAKMKGAGQWAGRMKVPLRRSFIACCNSAWVFMTIGPCQATGSSIGAPEISRKRMPCGPACTVTSSPVPKRIEGAVARQVADIDLLARDLLFQQHARGVDGIGKMPRALEDIGEGAAVGVDAEASCARRRGP